MNYADIIVPGNRPNEGSIEIKTNEKFDFD